MLDIYQIRNLLNLKIYGNFYGNKISLKELGIFSQCVVYITELSHSKRKCSNRFVHLIFLISWNTANTSKGFTPTNHLGV